MSERTHADRVRGVVERLREKQAELGGLAQDLAVIDGEDDENVARIRGKAQGVGLAVSVLEEELRTG